MLATDLAYGLDPVLFARDNGLEPDDWQGGLLRSQAQRILLNCSRQSGKSTITGLKATHNAIYRPGSLTLLMSPTLRQSQELFRKSLVPYRAAGRPVPAESENKLSLELENGSRIVSLPGKEGTVRGFSAVDLLIVDEAAWVPESLYMSVQPMLAVSGGRLIALSTPHGNRGWFYNAWVSQEPWERYEVPATMCPRIPPEFLEEARRMMGAWWFSQEYECVFLDAETAAFRQEDIDKAFSMADEVEEWDL